MSLQGRTEPDIVKLYYRIGEVARMVDVDPSVLRHWESEFRGLRPFRSKSGQRLYRPSDIRKVLEIKRLLYDQKFTTKGAVQHLRTVGLEPRDPEDPVVHSHESMREALLAIRKEITEFLATLNTEGSS